MTADDRTIPMTGGGAIPVLGFGTWQATGQECYDAVRAALDVGYRHIDTATIYRNEGDVGRALNDSGVPRSEVFVTTKLPPERAGRERQTIERSLRDLGTDYVDLWLIHWPAGGDASPKTWQALVELRDEGLARAVGVSNYSPAQVDELIDATGVAPAVNQIRWSPAVYDESRLAHSRQRGVVLEGYSPFKASDLSDPVLAEVASAHGVTPAQVVLRWHIDTGVVVIPKSARPERIAANFDVWDFALTADEVSRVSALSA
ncbi:MAG TPA: aldo/keto reductase [Mycobacteriales bacterium]|jgi:diketogulonate reductase-like aldo/keto reductase|nr:aldo/keto reductase [Mycobacteriales bacterium]